MLAHRPIRPVSLLVLAVAVAAALSFGIASQAATTAAPLVGSTSMLGNVGSTQGGQAEAFKTTASASGTMAGLRVYVDATAAAGPLTVGLYTDSPGHPGKLLASGSISSRVVGAWNTVPFGATVAVASGATYWMAVLGPAGSGTLRFRDGKSQPSETAKSRNMISLPASWSATKTSRDGGLSAYSFAAIDSTAPTTPTGLTVAGVAGAGATLTWNASSDDVGVAGYSLYLDGAKVGSTASATTFAFGGLACGSSYTLGVTASDAAGNTSAMATTSVSTAACADSSPPSTPTNVSASGVTQSQATLSWSASTDNVGVTGYRVFVGGSQVGSTSSTSYTYTGLSCATSYTLGVAALDAAGNASSTASGTVTTAACPDTTAPSAPSTLTTTGVTQSQVTLSWSASTDNVGVTGYRVFRNGTQVGTPTATSYTFSGLTCGTTYTLGVAAVDAAGNASLSSTTSVTTAGCPDTSAPSVPVGLLTSGVGQSSVGLSWNVSTDNVGVAGYRLFLNGTQVGTSVTPSFIFGGLNCGSSYTLGVAAFDAAGNVSATATTGVATSACLDTTAPSAPAGLAASAIAQTQLTLTWQSSSDNVLVTGYHVFVNGSQVATTAATSYGVSGLACGTSYSLGVSAFDAAGNASSQISIPGTTTACSASGGGGQAVIFVAPSGTDSSCTRGSSPVALAQAAGHVCSSFNKACHLAQSGDTVLVEDGVYGAQSLNDCTGLSGTVTFRTEPGHECPYSALTPASQLPAQSSDTTCPVTIDGNLDVQASYRGDPTASNLKNLAFVGMYAKQLWSLYAHNISFSHMAATYFYVVSSDTVTIDYGDFGNVFNGDCSVVAGRGPGTPDSSNVTIRGNIFHDSMRVSSTQSHPDGLFIQGLNGGVIDGNVFYRNAVLPLYLNSVAGGSIQNITITNNVIHDVVDMTDTGDPTRSQPRGNFAQQTLSLGDNSLTNVTVAFNSMAGFIRRQDNTSGGSGSGPTTNLRVYGNNAYGMLWQSGRWGCGDNTSYDYNSWFGAEAVPCGPHDQTRSTTQSPFVSDDKWDSQNHVTPGDYTLAAGASPVAFVPTSWCSTISGICPSRDLTGASRPNPAHVASANGGAYENR